MHVGCAVTLAGETVAQPEKGPRGGADHRGQLLDNIYRDAGDSAGPGRGARGKVRLQCLRAIGVLGEVVPVGMAVAKE